MKNLKCLMNGCDLIVQDDCGEAKRVHGDLWRSDNQLVFLGNYDPVRNAPRWIEEGGKLSDKEITLPPYSDSWDRRGIWIFSAEAPQWSPAAADYLAKWG